MAAQSILRDRARRLAQVFELGCALKLLLRQRRRRIPGRRGTACTKANPDAALGVPFDSLDLYGIVETRVPGRPYQDVANDLPDSKG
jgi:hypothetical protein